MRFIFLALIAVMGLQVQAQKTQTLNQLDAKGRKQGPWVLHYPALRTEPAYDEEGVFVDDRKEGVWKRFTPEGDLLALEGYRHNMKNGVCQYYTPAGDPLRQESWRAVDSAAPYDTVPVYDVNDPTRIKRLELVKMEPKSYKDGEWIYYETDPMSGRTTTTREQYKMDRLKEKPLANMDELKGIDENTDPAEAAAKKKEDEAKKKEKAKPQAVLDWEKANSGKKKVKMRDGATGG